ncbi:Rik1-associated factor 1 [Mactra antiquata]
MDDTKEKMQKVSSNSERMERVQAVISEIAANARNKGLQRKMPVTRAAMAQQKSSKREEYKLHIGWLHYQRGRFRQVSSKRNGGNRTVPYKKQEPQTVKTILDMAKSLFFPNGKSTHGHLSEMDVCLSNYDGEIISEFVGSDGHPCSLQEYLKSQGIYSSQFYVYLRTRQKVKETIDSGISKNLFLVDGKNPEKISIKYAKETQSSYSHDNITVLCSSMRGCYEMCAETHLKGTFDEYCPFLDGFHLNSLTVGKVRIIEKNVTGETVYTGSYQSIDTASGNTKVYSPSVIHGYEHDGTLILCVVLVNSNRTNMIHWYKNGEIMKSGENVFAISVDEPGLYSVGFELDDELFRLDPPVNVSFATEQVSQTEGVTLTETLMDDSTSTAQINPTAGAALTEPLMTNLPSTAQISPTVGAEFTEPLFDDSTSLAQISPTAGAALREPLMTNLPSTAQISPTAGAALREPLMTNLPSTAQISPTARAALKEPLMDDSTSTAQISPTARAALREPLTTNLSSTAQISSTAGAALREPLMTNLPSTAQISPTAGAALREPLMTNLPSTAQISPTARAALKEPLMDDSTSTAQISPTARAALREPLTTNLSSTAQISSTAGATLLEPLMVDTTPTTKISPISVAALTEPLMANSASTVNVDQTKLDLVMDSSIAGQDIEPPSKRSKNDTFNEPGTVGKICSGRRDNIDINVEDITIPKIEVSELTLHEKIGEGAFGEVFRGNWLESNIAVKRLKVKRMRLNKKYVLEEVKVHSKIRHPNIVLLMAYAINKDDLYLVSECIQGLNLDDLLFGDNEHKLDMQKKNNIAVQICMAVCYLHNRRPVVIHRDIKPENILISETLEVAKLCDLGLSKLKTLNTVVTTCAKKDAQSGTPVYQSPEVLVERKKCTVAADVWSLCCTLVELYTEEPIWEIEENEEDDCETSTTCLIQCMSRYQRPHGLSHLQNRNLPCQILDVITSGLDYLPSKRPSSLRICSVLKTHM